MMAQVSNDATREDSFLENSIKTGLKIPVISGCKGGNQIPQQQNGYAEQRQKKEKHASLKYALLQDITSLLSKKNQGIIKNHVKPRHAKK